MQLPQQCFGAHLENLGYEFEGIIGNVGVVIYFPLGKLDLVALDFFIGDVRQKVRYDVQARTFLVVGFCDVPGSQGVSLRRNMSSRARV